MWDEELGGFKGSVSCRFTRVPSMIQDRGSMVFYPENGESNGKENGEGNGSCFLLRAF